MQSTLLSSFSTIRHIFTTRHGGVSNTPYNTHNLAFHVGDDPGDVNTNHLRLAQELDYDVNHLIHMRQIHSDKIIVINDSHRFDNPPECDAVITNRQNSPLMVMTADCTPVLLFDPKKKVIAAVHAGRSGAFKAIVSKTIAAMQSKFESESTDIIAVLGPSIHNCCYEIGKTIATNAEEKGFGYAVSVKDVRYYLDVNTILRQQLKASGILQKHIEDLHLCTSCEKDAFFSYRAEEQVTGRMAAVILLV